LKKILIIRFSSIGDIVLTTPVIRCLKQQLPGCDVHYLTKIQYKAILVSNPYIDKIYTIELNINEVINAMKAEKYDFIVDLHKNFRSLGIRNKLRVKAASFPKLNLQKWLLVQFKINKMPPVHIVERYFEAVKHLGVKNDLQGLDYFIPKKDEVNPKNLPENFHTGYIGFVIGGQHKTKQLPVEKSLEILQKIDRPVLILGGPEDHEQAEEIINLTEGTFYNACGKFNINQSASLVKQADAIITGDTGLMHIAAAFRKKIISVWGNTVPEFGMFPYMPGKESLSKIFEVKGLPCRPCSKIGFDKCPKGHFDCMNLIDTCALAGQLKKSSQ
jgi:ADP-heptose:LPS heptosyltransferase